MRLLPRTLSQVGDQIPPLLRLRNQKVHLVPRNKRIRIGQPFLQRLAVPDNRRLLQRRRINEPFRHPRSPPINTQQSRPFVTRRQRMATRATLLKPRLAAHRITLAQTLLNCSKPRPRTTRTQRTSPLSQRSHIAIADPRTPMNHSILHQRHRMSPRLLHHLRRQRLLLHRRVALPRRKIHRLARPQYIPLHQPRGRRKPPIQRSPRLVRMTICALLHQQRPHRLRNLATIEDRRVVIANRIPLRISKPMNPRQHQRRRNRRHAPQCCNPHPSHAGSSSEASTSANGPRRPAYFTSVIPSTLFSFPAATT